MNIIKHYTKTTETHKQTQTNTWSGTQHNVGISGHVLLTPLQKSRRIARQPLSALQNTARLVGKRKTKDTVEVHSSLRVFTCSTRLSVCSKRVWFERGRELRLQHTSSFSLFHFYFGTLSPTRARNKSPGQSVTAGLRVQFALSRKKNAKLLCLRRRRGPDAMEREAPQVTDVQSAVTLQWRAVLTSLTFNMQRGLINANKLWRQIEDLTCECESQLPRDLWYRSVCC